MLKGWGLSAISKTPLTSAFRMDADLSLITNVSTARLWDLTVAFGLVWGIFSQSVLVSFVIEIFKSVNNYKNGINKKTHRIGGFEYIYLLFKTTTQQILLFAVRVFSQISSIENPLCLSLNHYNSQ